MTNITQLSDTQRTVLTTACEGRGGRVLPLTAGLKGGAVPIVLKSLLGKGLVAEVPARGKDPVWRTTDEGAPLTLQVTKPAYAALGIAKLKRADEPTGAETRARAPRTDTKQALLIGLLQRPEGATVAEIMAATAWQAHTVRGAIAGALRKRLGLTIISDTEEGRGRVYRVAT